MHKQVGTNQNAQTKRIVLGCACPFFKLKEIDYKPEKLYCEGAGIYIIVQGSLIIWLRDGIIWAAHEPCSGENVQMSEQ